MDPSIVFEDVHLIVLDKPAGLLSQGEHTGDANIVDWLRSRWGRPYVGLVHRLDRNTSGLMVVAKRTKAAERLTKALQAGDLTRSYLAWIEGALQSPGTWEHWLEKNEATNVVAARRDPKIGAKRARLQVEPVTQTSWLGHPVTLARFRLETGRSHQIRAQAKAEGHPVLGDLKYGARRDGGMTQPLLHSAELSFPHPMSHEVMRFSSAPPTHWPTELRKLQN